VEIYTIGFAGRKAADFFGKLKQVGIKRIIDVRLNNTSQLAGFTKKDDLQFFLKQICQADYIHEPLLAPTDNLLKDYRKKKCNWEDYKTTFNKLMADREIDNNLNPELFELPTALLCSEAEADHCHRRLIVEYLQEKWGDVKIIHL
jgi:uncharacterized protein (DUF488 family)